MKNNQKLSLMVWLRKGKATKDGTAPVYIRVTIDGKDEEISIGLKVRPEHWDSETKRLCHGAPSFKTANKLIEDSLENLETDFKYLCKAFEKLTPLMLKKAFLKVPLEDLNKNGSSKVASQSYSTLLSAYDYYIINFAKRVEKKLAAGGTLRHWRSSRKKVLEFIVFKFGMKDIGLSEVKYAFSENFYSYLTTEVESPLAKATANKHIKKLKQILEICSTNEWISKNPIKAFKCSGDSSKVIPLELGQVETIYRKEINTERLSEVRDAFIFQCFTGFAYQDVYGLTPENIISVGKKGELWLIKDRGKTGVTEMVPILPVVSEIIERYKGHPKCRQRKGLLPINSNARYNGYLKELAGICGINRDLNTHLARHTFADMMLNLGIPLEDVSKMLGHTNMRTTQRYAQVQKHRISENMEKVRNKLFKDGGNLRRFD
jgi:site-specific recombinase XerD